MLIVADASHSCHCFIVIFISFWFWCVSTSSRRRSLVVSRVTLTICKHSLLRCLRSHCSESLCVLIFIEALDLRRASVSSRMLFEYVLIVFDRCLTSLIELFWVMFDCLSTLCRLCLYTRSQQRISRQDVSLSLSILLFRHDESTLSRRLLNAWRILSLFFRRSLWLRYLFRSRSSKLFISSSTYQLRVIASLSHRCCLSWFRRTNSWRNHVWLNKCYIALSQLFFQLNSLHRCKCFSQFRASFSFIFKISLNAINRFRDCAARHFEVHSNHSLDHHFFHV